MIDVDFDPSIAQLQKDLNALSAELKVKAVRSGLTAAAKPVKATMKSLAPSLSGRMASAIGQRQLSQSDRAAAKLFTGAGTSSSLNFGSNTEAIIVGPNKKVGGYNQAYKGALMEFGVKAHSISLKKKGEAKALILGGGKFAWSVYHPGVKATGFMNKSLELNRSGLQEGFYQGLAKHLDKLKARTEKQ